ncbi:glycosyltransferase family 4 protein [Anoxybacillus kestanbolensis]|uniref:glycosyltransferase family 4 protein n=1 Tax=Anoxybacillus kestanbolensis TaxID=227476 RepID=UPI00208DD796|nr:glycosyltransferase family 4 protein [Anoxybacillus kestanbolensis]
MNIWIFNHYANGPNSVGVTRHYDLAKHLVKSGHEVTIFASSFNHWTKKETIIYRDKEYFKTEYYDGIRFVWIKTTPYQKNDKKRVKNMFSYFFNVRKAYKKISGKPNVVIGSIMHPLAAVVALYIAKRYKADFLFEERDLWPQTLVDLGKVSPRNPIVLLLYAFEKYMYSKAKKIIVLFENAPNYVISRGIKPEKIVYLPNGVDIDRYNNYVKLPLEIEKQLKNLDNKFKVVYAGAHSLANNLSRMIDLAYLLKNNTDIHFLLIGDGTEKKALIEKSNQLGLENITFFDPLPKEYIPSFLARCDLGFISLKDSSLYKWGFSLNKMYDYMAAGLPIVIDTSIKDNVISRNNLGIVSNNLEEISEQIIFLSKSDLSPIKEKLYLYVKENHDWKKLSDKLIRSIVS